VLVIIHGESPVEPVAPGTNRAGIESGADILAHPGFVTPEEVKSAAKNGICLEITSRNGHSLTNGHVGRLAVENGATLVIDTDTHTPDNLITRDRALQVLIGAGLTDEQAWEVLGNNEILLEKLRARMKEVVSGR
jgi:histidinol phosphatase-like PHP family hydrolase